MKTNTLIRWLPLSISSLITVATAPRLALNWGTDCDAWRVARTSARLWHGEGYEPSRLPGNPAFELLMAPAAGYNCPLAANCLVLLFFLAAVWVFYKIAAQNKSGARWSALFALTPMLLLNAATTMDYVPALACLLLACLLAYSGRAATAALVLGIAGGFRISQLLFALPLLYYNHGRGISPRRNLAALSITALTSLVFYLPVISSHGLDTFRVGSKFLSGRDYLLIAGYNGLAALGPTASLAIMALTAAHLPRLFRAVRAGRSDRLPRDSYA